MDYKLVQAKNCSGFKVNTKQLGAALVLSDGSVFEGQGFGACAQKSGELVFNTSMMGYQEALTDPSYAGQILLMSYPLVGNYGTDKSSFESEKIHASGFCVFEESREFSHKDGEKSISRFLEDYGVPGICGIDTRAIVRKIRGGGVMPAAIGVYEGKPEIEGLRKLAANVQYANTDFVKQVSVKESYTVGGEGKIAGMGGGSEPGTRDSKPKNVVLLDLGAKKGIERQLVKRGLKVTVMPAFSSEKEIRGFEPDGIVLSNGPGDPARLQEISNTLKSLFDLPIFGVCLGHQLLGQAAGAKTYKLKFGHRGANHPVQDLKTKKVAITSQNHGYAVDAKGLGHDFEETHINLNDRTNEGIAHRKLPIFSVQYHPEACPGPRDSEYLFDRFVKNLGGE